MENNTALTAEEIQQCPSCKAYFTKKAKYCPHCGRQLITEEAEHQESVPSWIPAKGYLIHTADDQSIPIGWRTSMIIGSLRQKCDCCIENTAVSRIHAEIIRRDQDFFIKDLRSRNHTFLNGEELVPNEEKHLKNGDEIRFANEKFTFEVK